MNKIIVQKWFVNKLGESKHTQKTTYGVGKEPVHAAKSDAGRALKFYADRVTVSVNGEVVFKGSKARGVKVNVSSDTFI